jgi:hypothetical protein
MKKALLIIFLLIPFIVFSQTTKPIDGFLGIKFGSSKTTVIAAIHAKGGKINKENSTGHSLAFDNVKLGHNEAAVFLVKFIDNKAYEADFGFRPDKDDEIVTLYNDLVSGFNQVYGSGVVTNNHTSPYQADNGNTIAGITSGNIDMHTLWQSSNTNTIYITIMTQLAVRLVYQDHALSLQAVAEQKAKDAASY